jgi:hypothetical protein
VQRGRRQSGRVRAGRQAGVGVEINGGAPLEGGSVSSARWAVLVYAEACGGFFAVLAALLARCRQWQWWQTGASEQGEVVGRAAASQRGSVLGGVESGERRGSSFSKVVGEQSRLALPSCYWH